MLLTHVPYSPIVERPVIAWPERARVALWIVPNVELREYLPPPNPVRDPWPRVPHPDVQQYSFHDYGNRVGFWRMLSVFDDLQLRCTVSLNLAVLERFPEIRDAIVERNWEVMGHGIYNTRYLYHLSESEERAFYRECFELAERLAGQRLRGMLGPSVSASERTPDPLAEAGFVYHADWALDDQPVPLTVPSGRLVAMPYTYELNDAALFRRHVEGDEYVTICKAQFDRLYEEGAESGRVMCLPLHPYLIGQPHRIGALAKVLAYIRSHDLVWIASGSEIAEYYLTHYYDLVLTHATRLAHEGRD